MNHKAKTQPRMRSGRGKARAKDNLVSVYFPSTEDIDIVQKAADASSIFRGNRSAYIVATVIEQAKKDLAKGKR